jgi:YD repeat-containing protein
LANRFDQLDQDRRNSLHWGPLQYALSADFVNSNFDVDQLTPADYALWRLRHWLIDPLNGFPSSTLSLERSPSPDGVTPGVMTWYDYPGKGHGANALGTPAAEFRGAVASGFWVLSRPQFVERNQWLHETLRLSYTQPDGRPGLRTDRFEYDPYGLDLTRHSRPMGASGEQRVQRLSPGRPTTTPSTNAPSSVTMTPRPTCSGRHAPDGLSTTFYYDRAARLTQVIDLPINRTNSFTYYNNGGHPNLLVRTHTDARGLTVTYFWDRHHRLTGMLFPDGSTRSNVFTALELTASKNRLGHWTSFGYDANRRLVAITNANAIVTAYGYCDCGALSSVTNALGTPRQEETRFAYDFAGNPRHVYLPDGTMLTHTFDPVGRLIASTDGTASRSFTTTTRDCWTRWPRRTVARPWPMTSRIGPWPQTDASGATVVNTFDALGRLHTRTGPMARSSNWSYTRTSRAHLLHPSQPRDDLLRLRCRRPAHATDR